MAKINDYNEVYNAVLAMLEDDIWSIMDYCEMDDAATLITNIYMMGQTVRGFGQDLQNGFSVISSPDRILVIYDGCASYYKNDEPMVLYEDLTVDLTCILNTIQAAIERMEAYR